MSSKQPVVWDNFVSPVTPNVTLGAVVNTVSTSDGSVMKDAWGDEVLLEDGEDSST